MFAIYLAKQGSTVEASGAVGNSYNNISQIEIEGVRTNIDDTDRAIDAENIWKEASILFTADEEMVANGVYAGFSVGTFTSFVYVDDFDLKEVSERPYLPEGYISAQNWGIYEGNSPDDECPDVLDGTGKSEPSGTTAYVANNYDKNFIKGSDGSSLLVNWHLHLYATKLTTDDDGNPLEKGQAYTLKFNYFLPAGSVSASDSSWATTGVFAEGTMVAKGGTPASYYETGAKLAGVAGKWHEYTVIFEAGDEPLYFGLQPNFRGGLKIYIDGFSLAKGDTRVFDTPKDKYVIDFEGNKQYIEDKYTDRYQIKNGSLYYKPGKYDTGSTLNEVSVREDNNSVYTLPVYPNKVYKISYRIKIDPANIEKGEYETDKAGYFASSMGKTVNGGTVVSRCVPGQWKTYTTYYSTGKYDRCLSISFNLGKFSSGVWFDDVVVELTDRKVFEGHGDEPIEYFQINFDDYNINLDSPFTAVEKAPERNGKSTNALHILPGQEDTVTFNASKHYSGIKDDVLTIPCEPNTVYKFSFWSYNETARPTYFVFFYNFFLDNRGKNYYSLHNEKAYAKEWRYRELIFTTGENQTSFNTYLNAGTSVVETWIDDITFEKLKTGVDTETNLTYCESMYDQTDKLSNVKDFMAGKAGTYRMALEKDQFYTVAATFSGKGQIIFSFDGVNPMEETGRGGKPIINIDSSGERFGVSIYSGKEKYLYIIIKNPQGLKLDNCKIFNSLSINGAKRPMGYETDPNVPSLQYIIKELKAK
jgi:hypothetical protein